MMGGDGSLGYWSRKTSHFPSRFCNDDDESSEEEGLGVSLGEESHGYVSLETSHPSTINHRGC